MSLRGVLLAVCVAVHAVPAVRAHAQFVPAPAGVSVRTFSADGGSAAPQRDSVGSRTKKIHIGPLVIPRRDSSWWVPLASAVVPGTGQALLGQDRFIAYLAVEGFAILEYLDQRSAQNRATARYEALAGNIARSLFPAPYPVGTWAYYESMEHYKESGVFNLTPGGAFTPEVDATTYNGASWLLARQTFWSDPNVQPALTSSEYVKAFAFYTARAVQPQFRWSWTNAQLEWDVYIQTIAERNQAARDARMNLGILLANHILSMVDSYVTLRVHGGLGAQHDPARLSASIPWAPFGRPSKP
jgi:hypothetical protein